MRNFHLAGRSTVHAQNAMVATSHPLAALTAIEVLRSGGTAADAAVAACALLGVIEPQSTGIGGDCFALIQPRGEGKIVSYNGSGRAPKAAKPSWYLERNIHAIPLTSAHAVSIPGAVDAWATILRDHGKLGLDTLLQPAIKAAEEGYVVAPRIAFDWKNAVRQIEKRHQHRALSAAARQAGGRRRRDPSARTGQDLARDRQGWPRRLLHGRHRRGHGGDAARHRRPAHAGGFRRPHHRDHGRRSAPSTRATTSGSARRTVRASPCW